MSGAPTNPTFYEDLSAGSLVHLMHAKTAESADLWFKGATDAADEAMGVANRAKAELAKRGLA